MKKTGKAKVVGVVGFYLRSGLKAQYINMKLTDNTDGWRSDWFYVANQKPELPKCTSFGPVKVSEWEMQLTSLKEEELNILLTDLSNLKEAGLTCNQLQSSTHSTNQGSCAPDL